MVEKRDVHGYEQRYNNALGRVTKQLPKHNVELVLKLDKALAVARVSFGRRAKVLNTMLNVAKWLDKDLSRATKADIDDLVLKITSRNYSDKTVDDYLQCVKQFYYFLETPELVKKIKSGVRQANKRLPDNKLDATEARKIIDKMTDLKYRCFFEMLFELSARPSELMSLKAGDVKFSAQGNKPYAMVSLYGKTGQRQVPIFNSLPYLTSLLKLKQPDDYLFPMAWLTYNRVLKQVSGRKDLTMYDFRRARATELSQNLTEAQLCAYHGWRIGSSVVQNYVKLGGKTLVPTLASLSGETVECQFCHFNNNPALKVCDQCMRPLDKEQAEAFSKVELGRVVSQLVYDRNKDFFTKEAAKVLPEALKVLSNKK